MTVRGQLNLTGGCGGYGRKSKNKSSGPTATFLETRAFSYVGVSGSKTGVGQVLKLGESVSAVEQDHSQTTPVRLSGIHQRPSAAAQRHLLDVRRPR